MAATSELEGKEAMLREGRLMMVGSVTLEDDAAPCMEVMGMMEVIGVGVAAPWVGCRAQNKREEACLLWILRGVLWPEEEEKKPREGERKFRV